MNNSLLFILLCIHLIVLSGCTNVKAPDISRAEIDKETLIQKKLEIVNTMRYQKKLDRIAYPIMRGGYSFCEDKVTADIGMRLTSTDSFPNEMKNAAKLELNLDKRNRVLWIVKGTPAENSGIQVGDEIISVNGNKLPDGNEGLKQYKASLEDSLKQHNQAIITVLRDTKQFTYEIEPDKVCDYPVVAILNATPNAYADGSIIGVHSGLLRLFDNERDIAVVLGHELAHNVKGHIKKGMMAAGLGILVDLAIGFDFGGDIISGAVVGQFSPSLEEEADYVGLYIAVNSGVEINGAEEVWRKFAAEFSGGKEKTLLDTHPPTPQRYIALRKTIQEIDEKQKRGLSLTPNK